MAHLRKLDGGNWQGGYRDPAGRERARNFPRRVDYGSLLRNQILPSFGAAPINRIDAMAITAWVGTLQASGLSASRVRQAAHLLGAMCKMAARTGYLARNPVDSVDLPRSHLSSRSWPTAWTSHTETRLRIKQRDHGDWSRA